MPKPRGMWLEGDSEATEKIISTTAHVSATTGGKGWMLTPPLSNYSSARASQ